MGKFAYTLLGLALFSVAYRNFGPVGAFVAMVPLAIWEARNGLERMFDSLYEIFSLAVILTVTDVVLKHSPSVIYVALAALIAYSSREHFKAKLATGAER